MMLTASSDYKAWPILFLNAKSRTKVVSEEIWKLLADNKVKQWLKHLFLKKLLIFCSFILKPTVVNDVSRARNTQKSVKYYKIVFLKY